MSRAKDDRLRAIPTREGRARQWFIEATERGDRLLVDDFASMLVAFAEFEMASHPELDDEVASFHGKFAHPAPSAPTLQSQSTFEFRCKLIREEAEELCEALMARDLGRIAAEAVDLLYVTLGTLVACGLRVRPFFNLVHRANMLKEPNPAGGKPLKPEGWEKPDTASLIDSRQVTDLDYPATLRARSGDEWPMGRFCDNDE